MGRFGVPLIPQSLIVRIGGALLLAGLLPIFVALGITYRETSNPRVVDQRYFVLLADHTAQDVADDLQMAANSVQAIAQDGVIIGHLEGTAAAEDRLRQFNRIYPVFRHLTLVDTEGRTVASSTYRYRGDWRQLEVFRLGRAGERAISPANYPRAAMSRSFPLLPRS